MKATSTHDLAITSAPDPVTGELRPLLHFPIGVCSMRSSGGDDDVRFDLASPDGQPVSQRYIDADGTLYTAQELIRGKFTGDEFREVSADDLDAIGERTKLDTMAVLGRIDVAEMPWDRVTATHFLQSPALAKGGQPKVYRLIYEALRAQPRRRGVPAVKASALITKRIARSRQKLAAIYADEQRGCLVMVELLFAALVKEPDEALKAPLLIDVDQSMVEKARAVIAAMPDGGPALDAEVDEALALRRELVEKALEGATIAPPTKRAAPSADDGLEAALLASVAALA